MDTTTRTVEGTEVTFFAGAPGGRWVFAGCTTAGGYPTVDGAATEAAAQLTGKVQGRLAAQAGHRVDAKAHRAYYKANLLPLQRQS